MIKPLFQKILILVNGSEESIHAAQYGILMSKLYRCNVKVVYVVDTATLKQLTLSKIFVTEESSEYEDSLRADGMRYLEYITDLAKSKDIKIETELRSGAVWSETVTAADEMGANLILIGGAENTDGGHEVLRETYRLIMQNSPCSVLLVEEKQIEQLFKLA